MHIFIPNYKILSKSSTHCIKFLSVFVIILHLGSLNFVSYFALHFLIDLLLLGFQLFFQIPKYRLLTNFIDVSLFFCLFKHLS